MSFAEDVANEYCQKKRVSRRRYEMPEHPTHYLIIDKKIIPNRGYCECSVVCKKEDKIVACERSIRVSPTPISEAIERMGLLL